MVIAKQGERMTKKILPLVTIFGNQNTLQIAARYSEKLWGNAYCNWNNNVKGYAWA
jgi:hypothetical protein